MVSINKSFLYGIAFASLTWIISLYLYTQLTKSVDPNIRKLHHPSYTYHVQNVQLQTQNFNKINSNKDYLDKNDFKKINTDDLLSELAPVEKHVPNNKLKKELFELGLVRTAGEQKIRDEGYKLHAYNILLSSKLNYHREIPDTRNALCKNLTYNGNLPDASIVICFYNEHYHTLLRTIYSVLDRTPEHLLKDIILVDDFSDIKGLHEDISKYLKDNKLDKVKLFKAEKREGLIRARIFGAKQARGNVLIFLDSHIEVNKGWIEPLLARIKDKKSNVAMPVIDIINPDTFEYTSSPLVRGGFNWGLHFKWEGLPKGTLDKPEDFIKPIRSPTMAGGLFAIDRKYFIDIGEYDAGMNIWGGENLEISFRIWMCGGSLELIPCSRVGHIFRQRRPYGSPDGQDTMLYNSLRVANVWMDDYKDYFLNHLKENKQTKGIDFGDISSRLQLRRELQCNDFDWYLRNIYPELVLPSDDKERLKKKWSAIEQEKFQPWHSRKRNYIDQFQIRLANSSLCIQSAKDLKTKGSSLVLRPCLRSKNQIWFHTDKNELVLAQLLCLQASKSKPILYKCHEMGADQEWKHNGGAKGGGVKGTEKSISLKMRVVLCEMEGTSVLNYFDEASYNTDRTSLQKNSPIYNLGTGTCLGVEQKNVNATVKMKLCTDRELNTWDILS